MAARCGFSIGVAVRLALVLAAGVLTTSACTDTSAPDTGAITITAAITGPDAGAAYMVSIDGGTPAALQPNARTVVSGVAQGSHAIRLTGLAPNCAVSGPNPITVTVASGATAAADFSVTCVAGGTLQVTVTTSGTSSSTSYTVGVDSRPGGFEKTADISPSGTLSIALPAGPHTLTLVVPANCTVTTPNNLSVVVSDGATADAKFTVVCTARGTLRVTATTTGAAAPDSYLAGVDSGSSLELHVPANGPVTVDLASGAHTVALVVPANCAVKSPNNTSVAVTAGAITDVTFQVACAGGDVRVTVTTTGPDAPATYVLAMEPVTTLANVTVPANGTTMITVGAGQLRLSLIRVPKDCTVASNYLSVTVPAGGTTDVAFSVTCLARGILRVSVVTTGANAPGRYRVELATLHSSVGSFAVDANGAASKSLEAGGYLVSLFAPQNCIIRGQSWKGVTIMSATTTDVAFRVWCH